MNLNERNYAGDHFVVGSLEVLGNIKGGGVKEIRKNVDLIQKQAEMIAKEQNQYWSDLSSDGVITPVEKQMLLKEYKAIQQSYAAIYTQAVSVGLDITPIFQDYIQVYDDLHTYLYETIKLFNDMNADTQIEDREVFDTMFSSYYYDESYVLVALSKGIFDTVNFRVLSSLNENGDENDIGIYRGSVYQYLSGQWRTVTTGNYKGALQNLPIGIDRDFFLVADNFTIVDGLYVNGEQLYINGEELTVAVKYKKGYIYYCDNGAWYRVDDKTDYRYVAAFADVLRITGELPGIFQEALDELDEKIQNIHIPSYLGAMSTLPQNPVNGDYFTYSGANSGQWRKSDVYRYENGVWNRLDPLLSQNSSYYMQALEDILALNNAGTGFFSVLFAQSFFANNAILESLKVQVLYLKASGAIQSENQAYIPNKIGTRIDADGNADFNGNTHIGGTCNIDGNVNIQGHSSFRGETYIGGNTLIENAEIITPVFECRKSTPTTIIDTFPVGTKMVVDLYGGEGACEGLAIDRGVYSRVWIEGTRWPKYEIVYDPNHYPTVYQRFVGYEETEGHWVEKYYLYYGGEERFVFDNAIVTKQFTYYHRISSDARTFKFKNLPTARPAERDILYVENGYLRLS